MEAKECGMAIVDVIDRVASLVAWNLEETALNASARTREGGMD
jgi:hypothetical protein